MNQSIDSILNFNESSEVGQVSHATVNTRSYLIALVQGLPGIVLNLFHSQANSASFWINAQHFNFNGVAGVNQLTGMLYTFRPAHLGNMDQPFDAIFKLYESAVVSDACNAS